MVGEKPRSMARRLRSDGATMMNRSTELIVVLIVSSASLYACTDNCEPPNLPDPALVNGLEQSADGPFIRIAWSAGTTGHLAAPDTYYADATLDSTASSEVRRLAARLSAAFNRRLATWIRGR